MYGIEYGYTAAEGKDEAATFPAGAIVSIMMFKRLQLFKLLQLFKRLQTGPGRQSIARKPPSTGPVGKEVVIHANYP